MNTYQYHRIANQEKTVCRMCRGAGVVLSPHWRGLYWEPIEAREMDCPACTPQRYVYVSPTDLAAIDEQIAGIEF